MSIQRTPLELRNVNSPRSSPFLTWARGFVVRPDMASPLELPFSLLASAAFISPSKSVALGLDKPNFYCVSSFLFRLENEMTWVR